MTEPSPESAPAFEMAGPFIAEAVAGQIDRDARRVAMALHRLILLGEDSFYGSLASFAVLATAAVPRGTQPGATWGPALFVGNPPRRVSIDADPAAAFAFRFLAATLNGDEQFRLALWNAFLDRAVGRIESEPEETRAEVASAFVLMVQLAARGQRAIADREHRTHQHPNARRRDQRKR